MIINNNLLLAGEEPSTAATAEVVEVDEGDCEEDGKEKQIKEHPIHQIVIIIVYISVCLDDVLPDVGKDDVESAAQPNVNLGSITAEADSRLLGVTPADAARLGHGEREDWKNKEGRIIGEDGEGGPVEVESCN